MELKQLEYFLVCCEQRSINKAAEKLFTSQPNVSKVIQALERELKCTLFERTSKGLRITQEGKVIQEHADHIMQNVKLLEGRSIRVHERMLEISTYPSNMVARVLTDMMLDDSGLTLTHRQGSVEEITDQVSLGESELGIVYISSKQLKDFRHIISHKRLKFVKLDTKEACVYVGPNHPLYHAEEISFEQLETLRFVRGTQEYFAMDHHLEQISLGAIATEKLKYVAYTNSDHMTINLLLNTDICSLGIDFISDPYRQYDVRALRIADSEPFLSIGYVHDFDRPLSTEALEFVRRFQATL